MALLLMMAWTVTRIDLLAAVAIVLAAASALVALASARWHGSGNGETRLGPRPRDGPRARGPSAYDGLVDEEPR
jgi:hypothetical protein